MYPIWTVLAWQDIKQRYRRSTLGPFWLTISTGIMIGALGSVYSIIFGQQLTSYLPFVGFGLVLWGFISAILNEACSVFIAAEGLIKQTRLPMTVYVARMVWRNIIVFGHNAVILIAIMLFFPIKLTASLLIVPLALLLYFFTSIGATIVLGIYCTRFRDISQIVMNATQVLFFLTPVMWDINLLQNQKWIAMVNPVYHYIEIIRGPCLGLPISWMSLLITISCTASSLLLAIVSLSRFRGRIAYWL